MLAVSLDQRVEQSLPKDERGTYVASLSCPHTGVTSLPCVLTGQAVDHNIHTLRLVLPLLSYIPSSTPHMYLSYVID